MATIVVGKKIWKCLLCDEEYTNASNLQRHLQNKKPKGHGKDLDSVTMYPNHIVATTKER